MINTLDLLRPIYQNTAVYGHFGRSEPDFTWELTDKADILRRAADISESTVSYSDVGIRQTDRV